MSFSFVTAYFQLDESKNNDYFSEFNRLVETNFPIVLFLDKKLENKANELKKNNNLKIVLLDWNDLYINKLLQDQVKNLKTPEILGNTIDNTNNLILLNSKTFFVKLALDLIENVDTLVWIDFDGLKQTNDIEHFKRNFSKLKKYEKVFIPGGSMEKTLLDSNKIMENINSRFLGSVFICPKDLVNKFNDEYKKEMEMLFKENKITWDVNIWSNIEYNNENLIKHFRSNNSKAMFGFYDKKVILLSMIKNEEKIIRRCIDSVKNVCDAFCINDTVSTDRTVEIVNEYILELEKENLPCKLYQDKWQDFGNNRTISYNNTTKYCDELGWDPESTYGILLDADMKLVVLPVFNKEQLTQNGYKIIQSNGHLDYHNTRFVRLNGSWKCVGVTHEYWDGPDLGTLNKDVVYINDVGDGGCKDDKFQRDMRLLMKGIEEDPTNGRYHFYLAQTCKDLGKFSEAIKLYKKRIALGGWDEEIWYAHYMIAKCWEKLGNIIKAEAWANKAYQYRKNRAEPLLFLTNLFRYKGENFKALHYYKLGKSIPESYDSLFVEKAVYKYLFDYEYTIIHYWTFPNERLDGLKHIVDYINKHTHMEDHVFYNMDFYLSRLADHGELLPIDVPILDNYCSSSSSIIEYNNKLLMNVRYVNYRIQSNGSYLMYGDNGSLGSEHHVKTKNGLVYLDDKYKLINSPILFDTVLKDVKTQETHIKGLEDIRLFTFKNKIHYVAVTKEYSYNENIRIILGEYDINNLKHINNHPLHPPEETWCEKNWIPINHKDEEILFIYKWYPFQIGKLDENYKLNITTSYDTPKIFKHVRGSTNLVEYENKLWCITHGVKYTTPRKYYHQFVILDKDTYKPIEYSAPFYFNKYHIEYTVGFYIRNNEAIIPFSQNDKDACMLKISMDKVKKYLITI
jgi:tetratricopeptide (TPR) repeat protein